MVATGCIVAEHGSFNRIRQVAPMSNISNTWFLDLMQVFPPSNGISFCSDHGRDQHTHTDHSCSERLKRTLSLRKIVFLAFSYYPNENILALFSLRLKQLYDTDRQLHRPEQGMGRWVMGQMGHENRMGHMGHGSLGVDP